MKKLLFVFALAAIVLVSGCKKEDPWKDCDQKVTKIELSDGTWEGVDYTYMKAPVTEFDDLEDISVTGDVEFEEENVSKFTVSNGKVNFISESSTGYYDFPSGTDTTGIQTYAALMNLFYGKEAYTASGTKVKWSFESSAEDLKHEYGTDVPVQYVVSEFKVDYDALYANEERTKYIYKFEGKKGNTEVEIKMTLAKQ